MPATERRGGGFLEALFGLGLVVGLLRSFGRRRPRLPGVDREDLAAGHETSDMSITAVVVYLGALVVTLGIIFAVVSWLQAGVTGQPFRLAPPASGLADSPTA